MFRRNRMALVVLALVLGLTAAFAAVVSAEDPVSQRPPTPIVDWDTPTPTLTATSTSSPTNTSTPTLTSTPTATASPTPTCTPTPSIATIAPFIVAPEQVTPLEWITVTFGARVTSTEVITTRMELIFEEEKNLLQNEISEGGVVEGIEDWSMFLTPSKIWCWGLITDTGFVQISGEVGVLLGGDYRLTASARFDGDEVPTLVTHTITVLGPEPTPTPPECPANGEMEQLPVTRPEAIARLPDGHLVVGSWASPSCGMAIESESGWNCIETPNFWVLKLAVDPRTGFIWMAHRRIGGESGVDGVSVLDPDTEEILATYTEVDATALDFPSGITFTNDGNLWVVGGNQVSRMNPAGEWRNYALPSGGLQPIAAGPGVLCTGGYQGVCCYEADTDSWNLIGLDEQIWGLGIDSHGNVWASGRNLYKISPEEEVKGKYILPSLGKATGVNVAVDPLDRPWVGSDWTGIDVFDPEAEKWLCHFEGLGGFDRIEALTCLEGQCYAGEFYSGTLWEWQVEPAPTPTPTETPTVTPTPVVHIIHLPLIAK